MRLKNLIFSEFRLLYKYGIVFLYIVFTALYLCLLAAIPNSAKEITADILVFTDPAAMGLFFMGAVVLLEKSQRVESSLGVSPITVAEYIIAKLVPFAVIGVLVSMILRLFAAANNILLVLLGVFLSSILFSICGLLVGANMNTLNGFIVATVPFEIVIFLPAILFLFDGLHSDWWAIHPGVAAVRLICGNADLWHLSALSLVLWLCPAYFCCKRAVAKSFAEMGGAKL